MNNITQLQSKRRHEIFKVMLYAGVFFPIFAVLANISSFTMLKGVNNLMLTLSSLILLAVFDRFIDKYFKLMVYIFLSVALVVFSVTSAIKQEDDYRLIWFVVLILNSFFVGGITFGMYYSSAVGIIVTMLLYFGMLDINTPTTATLYISAMVFVVFSYYFTRKLENAEHKVVDIHQNLLAEKETKERFLANASHEIRTPLNAIMGFLEILKSTKLTKEQYEYIKIIENSSDDLLRIINDILDLSKIDANKLELECIPYNLADLDYLIQLNSVKAHSKRIDLLFKLDERLTSNILTDPTRLKQVIQNLLSNGIKFTSSGHVLLKVDLVKEDELYYDVAFSISDTGLGIAKEKLSSIFQAYVQTDSSVARVFGGTGLGLNISKNLVTLLGGDLHVESKLDYGSTFGFTLRFKKTSQNFDFQDDDLHSHELLNLTVLVVDDVTSNRLLVQTLLKPLGIQTVEAVNGKEAFEIFQQQKFDLILMDGNMPILNGIDASKLIKAFESEHNRLHTPIIALSANAMKQEIDEMLSVMDGYLAKPITKSKLVETIKKFTQNSKDEPKIDYHEAIEALGISEADLREFLEIFIFESEETLVKLQQAIESDDAEQITQHAHAIKGAAANLRLGEIKELAQKIEYASKDNQSINIAQCKEDYANLHALIQSLKKG